MRHLNAETLARLVDEPPEPDEREHLRSCPACTAELRALREQTEALSSLPDVRPPSGDWSELEERLRAEGLIGAGDRRAAGSIATDDARRAPSLLSATGWLQAAAALVLFLGGVGVGAMAGPGGSAGEGTTTAEAAGESSVRTASTVDAAAEVLRSAEERYVDALVQYRRLADASGEDADVTGDPASRYAALETLVAASRAAIREAPADPFLNGVLASTMAERQDALRQISTSGDENWF